MTARRIMPSIGAAVGGLAATAFLTTAIAAADAYVYEPDGLSFVPLSPIQTGFYPISIPPLFEQVTGSEDFTVIDTNTHMTSPDAMLGDVLTTNVLGATETQFDEAGWNSTAPGALDIGSQVTLWQLPGHWGNELIFSSSVPLGLEDIVITPFGDFTF